MFFNGKFFPFGASIIFVKIEPHFLLRHQLDAQARVPRQKLVVPQPVHDTIENLIRLLEPVEDVATRRLVLGSKSGWCRVLTNACTKTGESESSHAWYWCLLTRSRVYHARVVPGMETPRAVGLQRRECWLEALDPNENKSDSLSKRLRRFGLVESGKGAARFISEGDPLPFEQPGGYLPLKTGGGFGPGELAHCLEREGVTDPFGGSDLTGEGLLVSLTLPPKLGPTWSASLSEYRRRAGAIIPWSSDIAEAPNVSLSGSNTTVGRTLKNECGGDGLRSSADESPTLMSLEEFFTENRFAGSIWCNLPSAPSPSRAFETLHRVRERGDVSDVRVEVTALDDAERPFSDRVWVVTSASIKSIRSWFPTEYAPDEVRAASVGDRERLGLVVPEKYRAVYCWWD